MNSGDERYVELARKLYAHLKNRSCGVVDWRAAEVLGTSLSELAKIVAASNGHVVIRPTGIVERAPAPPAPGAESGLPGPVWDGEGP